MPRRICKSIIMDSRWIRKSNKHIPDLEKNHDGLLPWLATENKSSFTYETNKVYVSNLSTRVTSETLKQFFEKHVQVTEAIVIRDTLTHKSRGFGFVSFSEAGDIEKLLNLDLTQRNLQGRRISIKTAFKKPSYQKIKFIPYSEKEITYNLDSLDSSKPCLHSLNDDILRHIFSFLNYKETLAVERVCKRFQRMVYEKYSRITSFDFSEYNKTHCIQYDNFIEPRLSESNINVFKGSSKYLVLIGDRIESLKLDNYSIELTLQLLQTIGLVCKNLKELDLSKCFTISNHGVRFLIPALPSLEKLTIQAVNQSPIKSQLDTFFKHTPLLHTLHIENMALRSSDLKILPKDLKSFHFSSKSTSDTRQFFELIAKSCPKLTDIQLLTDSRLSDVQFHILNEGCKDLESISINCSDIDCKGLRHFKKLKRLSITHLFSSVNLQDPIQFIPQIEELKINRNKPYYSRTLSVPSFDFSSLKCLKKIEWSLLDDASAKTEVESLYKLPKLEHVSFIGNKANNQVIDFVCGLLKSVKTLKTIDASSKMFEDHFLDKIIKVTQKITTKPTVIFHSIPDYSAELFDNVNKDSVSCKTCDIKLISVPTHDILYGDSISDDFSDIEDDEDDEDLFYDHWDDIDAYYESDDDLEDMMFEMLALNDEFNFFMDF